MIHEKRKREDGEPDDDAKVSKLDGGSGSSSVEVVRNVESEIRTLKGLIPGMLDQENVGEVSFFYINSFKNHCLLNGYKNPPK